MATIDTVAELASFERRSAGSDAERRAARWLAQELAKSGRSVKTETFWCRPNWALAHSWHVVLALAGSLVATSAPRVGVVLLTVALISVLADALTGRSLGRRLTPERASQNVVATKPSEAETRLIVTANYDAGPTGLIYRPGPRTAAAKMRRALGLLALGWLGCLCLGIVWLLAVAGIRAAGHDDTALNLIQLPPTVALVLGLAALIEIATSLPGQTAEDNASGTAVALALTRALDAAAPKHLVVELVLEGAGDPDHLGLRRYLQNRKRTLKPGNTVVLGIAASAAGTPHWWRTDGRLVPLRYSRRMTELAAKVATDLPFLHAEPTDERGAGPAFPARQRHLPALTIGGEASPGPPNPEALNQVTHFALLLVDAIDAFLATQEQPPERVATPA